MKKAEQGGCYGGTFSSSTIIATFLCFLLQPSRAFWVELSMEKFTIFALKEKSTHNTTIHFDIRLYSWYDDSLYHDALNITFYYKSNLTNFPVGKATFGPFYVPENGDKHLVGNFEATRVKSENIIVPPMIYRVEVASSYWVYLDLFFRPKRLYYEVGADLEVDDEGNLVNKGVVLFYSAAPTRDVGPLEMTGIIMLCVLYLLHSL